MIITKRIERKKIKRGEPVEYNIEYITEKPQKYINKYVKVQPVINEIKSTENTIPNNYQKNHVEQPIFDRTKEEVLLSLNTMLEAERNRIIEEEREKRLVLKPNRF